MVDLWRKQKQYLVGKNAKTNVQNHMRPEQWHTIFCYKAYEFLERVGHKPIKLKSTFATLA